MEIKIKTSLNDQNQLENFIKEIKKIEKEYNCNCTLLDIEVKHLY